MVPCHHPNNKVEICSMWLIASWEPWRLLKSPPKQNISAFQYQQEYVTVTTKKRRETVQWALAHANDPLHFWTAWDWKGSPSVAAVHHTNIWNGRVCSTSSCKGAWQKNMMKSHASQHSPNKRVHPGRLTWNIIIGFGVWKIILLSKWVICMFHKNLPGCSNNVSCVRIFQNLSNLFPLSQISIMAAQGGQLMSHTKFTHAPPCILADFNTPSLK